MIKTELIEVFISLVKNGSKGLFQTKGKEKSKSKLRVKTPLEESKLESKFTLI